jgi:hypothetical protein
VANDVVPDHITFTRPSLFQMRKPSTAGAINWYPGLGILDSDSNYTPEGSGGVPTAANDFTVSGEFTANGTVFLNAGGELSGPYSLLSGSTLTSLGTVIFVGATQTGISADSLDGMTFPTLRDSIMHYLVVDTTWRTGQTAAISTPVSLSGITAPGFYDIYFYYACTATGTSTNITPVFAFNDGVGAKTSSGLTALSASATTNWQSNVLTIYVGSGTPSWTTTMTGTGTYSIRVGVRRALR